MKQLSSVGIAGIIVGTAIGLLLSACATKRSKPDAIRIHWAHDPELLDPLQLANQPTLEANSILHTSLLQLDIAKAAFAPALAEAMPSVQLVGDSMSQIAYRLRPAAAWDDGTPVLASDVEFTLKLMVCPGLINEGTRNRYSFIRAVRPDTSNPRHFVLDCQGQALDYAQASGDFFVLPEKALDPRGQLRGYTLAELRSRSRQVATDTGLLALARRYQQATQLGRVTGCGAYQLVKWDKDQRLLFRRKAHWWADQLRPTPLVLQALPQQLEYDIIPDAATATLALRRGDLDVYAQMPAREFVRLGASAAARKELNFYTTSSHDVVIAGFNTHQPALADALTRQALGHCFDSANLLAATQLGGGQRTVGIISPTDRANYNNSLSPIPFDLQAAADLLRRAGWQRSPRSEDGWFRQSAQGARQQLRLVVRYRAEENLFATIALQFQAATASLGIPTVLQPTEAGAFSIALREGDFDLYIRILKGNPFMFNFTPFLHSLGIGEGNVTGFSTPASDRLIERIAMADSETNRANYLKQFQTLMQQEVPLVPLFFVPNRIAVSRELRGLHIGSIKPGYSVMTLERVSTDSPAP